jgi:hypothetical protein
MQTMQIYIFIFTLTPKLEHLPAVEALQRETIEIHPFQHNLP